jgi:hypothetical protein
MKAIIFPSGEKEGLCPDATRRAPDPSVRATQI